MGCAGSRRPSISGFFYPRYSWKARSPHLCEREVLRPTIIGIIGLNWRTSDRRRIPSHSHGHIGHWYKRYIHLRNRERVVALCFPRLVPGEDSLHDIVDDARVQAVLGLPESGDFLEIDDQAKILITTIQW